MKRIFFKAISFFLLTGSLWISVPFIVCGQFSDNLITLSASDIQNRQSPPYISDIWAFAEGDRISWNSPAVNDSSWQKVSTRLGPSELPFINWHGIGWFRTEIQVDSSLVNYPLALLIEEHNGASEIYLDGKLLYELGTVSTITDEFQAYHDRRPRPLILQDTSRHLLSIRYANPNADQFNKYGYNAGFRFLIGDMNQSVVSTIDESVSTHWAQLFYTGILLAFAIIHFLLFAFNPDGKKNLYFAIFAGLLAFLTLTTVQKGYTNSPMMSIYYHRISLIALVFTVIYALRFAYSLFSRKPPPQFWVFLFVGMGIAAITWFEAQSIGFYRDLFVVLTLLEIIRVAGLSFIKRIEGIWFVGIGLASFVCGVLYTVLGNLDIIPDNTTLGNLYGSTLLILTMSIYLSRDFAKTQKRLEHKLDEVKRLSEYAIEQERISKEQEIKRKLLEAENERKSRELEEARSLQLSMLPKKIPNHPYWDIAVFMDPAYEVGGDYYDFNVSKNGMLTIAMGDATGHGMKAGIIVATAKSYFHTLANDHDNLGIFRRMSSGIRNMELKTMYMSLMLLKCQGYTVKYLSAGMPPCLIYRQYNQSVEEVCLKGMPLGSKVEYPYKEKLLHFQPGDTLLLMSDGLVELFNERRELLGIERVKQCLKEVGNKPPSAIMACLSQVMNQWAGSKMQEDDITIMVLKAK